MEGIKKSIFVTQFFLLFGLLCHGRHLEILNTGNVQHRTDIAGSRGLISSPSMLTRRPRKVLSKKFQNLLNGNGLPAETQVKDNSQNQMSYPNLAHLNTNTNPLQDLGNLFGIAPLIQQTYFPNDLGTKLNLLAQVIKSVNNVNQQQQNVNLGNLNISPIGSQQINTFPQQQTINVQATRPVSAPSVKVPVPVPSLINRRVNTVSKTPIITMVPKRQLEQIVKTNAERKRITMLEKLKAIPAISLSSMKPAASQTLQNAVTDQRISSSKGNVDRTDASKIKVITQNNTAEVKIINEKPGIGLNDPNFIVLKDISITNTTDGGNGTVNGTKMIITLMSQATGGRPIVIEANSNVVLSQEKMPNGTYQFIIRSDTKPTTLGTTITTTVDPELEAEETTTAAITTPEV